MRRKGPRRRGRKRLNVERQPNGQPKRDTAEERRRIMAVATEARQRVYGLSEKESRDVMAGCALGRAILQNPTNPQQDNSWWQSGLEYEQAYKNYSIARAYPVQKPPGAIMETVSGYDSSDGDEPSYVEWVHKAQQRYRDMADAIVHEIGVGHFNAVHSLIIGGTDNPKCLGELRLALNVIGRMR